MATKLRIWAAACTFVAAAGGAAAAVSATSGGDAPSTPPAPVDDNARSPTTSFVVLDNVYDDSEAPAEPGQVTPAQIDAAAAERGYGQARSPSGAYIVDCLKAAGIDATYDDATGAYSFPAEVDPHVALSCAQELG
jgi:hypothetical protein